MSNHPNWHDQQGQYSGPGGSSSQHRHHPSMDPYGAQQQSQQPQQPSQGYPYPPQSHSAYPPSHLSPGGGRQGPQGWQSHSPQDLNSPGNQGPRSSGPYSSTYDNPPPPMNGSGGALRPPPGHPSQYGPQPPYPSHLHGPPDQHMPPNGPRGGPSLSSGQYDYPSSNVGGGGPIGYQQQQQQQPQQPGSWSNGPIPSVLQPQSLQVGPPPASRTPNGSGHGMGRAYGFPAGKIEEDVDDDDGAYDDIDGKGKGRAGDGAQAANKGTSDFVKKLFSMLDDKAYEHVVAWSPMGESFIVKDMNDFTKHVLPRNFRHSNFASFVRQLNKYDFHKVKNPEDGSGNVGEHIWEFQHPDFVRGREDLLENVKRKIPAKKKPSGKGGAVEGDRDESPILPLTTEAAEKAAESYSELKAQVATLTAVQDQMQNHIVGLTKQYQGVIGEMLTFQRNMVQQDQLMQNLIQYLMNLEQDRRVEGGASAAGLLGSGSAGDGPFLQSDEAAKLIGSYEDVAQASFAQMSEIARRAADTPLKASGGPSVSSSSDATAATSASRLTGTSAPSTAAPLSPKSVASPMNDDATKTPTANHPENANMVFHPPHLTGDEAENSLISAAASSVRNPSLSSFEKAGLRVFTVGTLQPREDNEDYLANNGAEASASTQSSLADAVGDFMKRPTPGSGNRYGLQVPQLEELPNNMPKVDGRNGSGENGTPVPQGTGSGKDKESTPTGGNARASPSDGPGSGYLRVRRSTLVPGWAVPPRVLLVDDDEVCRRLSSKFLQVFGCSIDYAVDGMSAVNKMNLEKYDLVLMDIVMPNLDGVSATSLIRQFDPRTPIISMTSNSGPSELINYMSSGMNDILPKPFTKEGLLNMLEKHLIHLKTVQKMEQIPRSLGLGSASEGSLQQALFSSASGSGTTPSSGQNSGGSSNNDDGMLNPLAGMGFSDEEYIAMLQNLIAAGTVSDSSGNLTNPAPGLAHVQPGEGIRSKEGTPQHNQEGGSRGGRRGSPPSSAAAQGGSTGGSSARADANANSNGPAPGSGLKRTASHEAASTAGTADSGRGNTSSAHHHSSAHDAQQPHKRGRFTEIH